MNWIKLTDPRKLEEIKNSPRTAVIFKHSTRCSISETILNRLERTWKPEQLKQADVYYLDLLSYRDISNKIAQEFQVEHESPQILVIENGTCVYTASHMGINFDDIKKVAAPQG